MEKEKNKKEEKSKVSKDSKPKRAATKGGPVSTSEGEAGDPRPEGREDPAKKAEEYLDGWKRCLADFDNYKKQQEKTFSELRQYASEDLIREIVPILDSFDLALKSVPEGDKTSEWKQGVVFIKGQLEDVLKNRGLEAIKAAGERFDPNIHDAVETVESDKESGMVIEEVQRGYRIGDRIVRPSRVKVSK